MNSIFITTLTTPIGNMQACATEDGVCLLEFEDRKDMDKQLNSLQFHLNKKIIPGKNIHLLKLQLQSDRYFANEINSFDLPLHLAGTDFQKRVWKILRKIPYGNTTTYMAVTKQLGNQEAIRAVAGAIAANKIAIIVPCHRVIGFDGKLTGYAGGLWRKKYLLDMEKSDKGEQLSMEF